MSESMKCHSCENPATVHLTQILNNQMHKIDLCEECAEGPNAEQRAEVQSRLVEIWKNFAPDTTTCRPRPTCSCVDSSARRGWKGRVPPTRTTKQDTKDNNVFLLRK